MTVSIRRIALTNIQYLKVLLKELLYFVLVAMSCEGRNLPLQAPSSPAGLPALSHLLGILAIPSNQIT